MTGTPMRFGYADPPYPGQSKIHYGDHADYAGEVDHGALVQRLLADYPDGWVLHTASTTLREVLALCPAETRIGSWGKSFASWKEGIYPAYAWEPVLFHGGRNRFGDTQTIPDFIVEPITLRRGLSGAKPERVCHWAFDLLGALPDDEMHDLFPGSGAVGRAWGTFVRTPRIDFPVRRENEPLSGFEALAD